MADESIAAGLRDSVRKPTNTRYPAPEYFTALNALGDAARIADKPTVAAKTCMNVPSSMPTTPAYPIVRPSDTLRLMMYRTAGPGITSSATEAIANEINELISGIQIILFAGLFVEFVVEASIHLVDFFARLAHRQLFRVA